MPLYRDSENSFPITIIDRDTGEALDISSYVLRLEMNQSGCPTVTLTMGDGLAFDDDGTDGIFNVTISKAKINQFSSGDVRVRVFNDAGSDPVLVAEGGDMIEGKRFDA